ncbi:uncharacterized protein EI90DRAFT_3080003 [Cantharellus anzutake]|uniref:uncharacterized protein n=1 Tax=Cantharellus anzutake TaxID=1750568 RepID=UPI00190718A0|nr:uncharacterized protein EI90DRAFT_3080003 [Cantharellus anzutake]KAF8321001.1 hypothetical protein EI90DRAFT_3080003 [Cantharellus anzutake]
MSNSREGYRELPHLLFYSTYGRGQNTNQSISYEDNGNEPKKTKDLPQVEDENTVPINYARRRSACLGDGGVGRMGTGACFTPNSVTTVGATTKFPKQQFASRRRFSDYFPRPCTNTMHTYEDCSTKWGAYPDVAAQDIGISSCIKGKSYVSRHPLTEALAQHGQQPMDLLSQTGVLNDITTGSNPGCGTTGFNATRGWDPATGFGTPDLPRLLKALKL